MSDEIVFYTNPMSRGRIIRWMLEEVGRPYRTVVLDWATNANKSPEYLAVNPMGKVPAIVHGDTVVTECAAICAYLADVFPETKLAPPHGSRLRGPYYRWLFFGAGPIEQAVAFGALQIDVPEERRAMVGFGSMADVLNTLEGALEGREYLVGDSFTAADLYIGAHLSWGMDFGTIEKRPVYEAYVARLMARPAEKRASEIDDGLIAAAQAQPA
ncbi:glutathione S-transferase family protein [Phenylobacterium sp. SCN 70-31]|uniref:glutathione S-transferase family protein n=1 Tax=Phenylobacterium sp. SCN 70-31 TaxID=1660129 RepID=UPI00086EDC0B|nr:glutathione S-transferase family protein [Phenylobacterium sp. SCN 70-31]ODT88713.1 MAG: glutathione S-transferase [Phenylobacterium sp. SCN 70-31]